MALQPIQGVTERWKTDADGDMALVIAPLASVAVYNESDGALAPLFAERDGLSGLPNPFTSDEYGRFSCYTATARVKIVVTTAAGEIGLFRNVPLLQSQGSYTATITPTTSGTVTLETANQTLYYTRIGDLVVVNGYIKVLSVSSPLGAFRINLPFTPKFTTGATICADGSVANNVADFWAHVDQPNNAISVFLGDGVTVQSDSAAQLQAGSDMRISATYETSDP